MRVNGQKAEAGSSVVISPDRVRVINSTNGWVDLLLIQSAGRSKPNEVFVTLSPATLKAITTNKKGRHEQCTTI